MGGCLICLYIWYWLALLLFLLIHIQTICFFHIPFTNTNKLPLSYFPSILLNTHLLHSNSFFLHWVIQLFQSINWFSSRLELLVIICVNISHCINFVVFFLIFYFLLLIIYFLNKLLWIVFCLLYKSDLLRELWGKLVFVLRVWYKRLRDCLIGLIARSACVT